MWPGEGEGVNWVGEMVAKEGAMKRSLSGGEESEGWSDLVWSDSDEERLRVEMGVEVKREEEEDIYTQTNRLFAESSEVGTEGGLTIKKEKRKNPEPSPPPEPPITSLRVPKQEPQAYTLGRSPRSRPAKNPSHPGPSTPRRANQKWIDDSEIMQHLVGGMANLGIPMSQDDGGRWRIQKG